MATQEKLDWTPIDPTSLPKALQGKLAKLAEANKAAKVIRDDVDAALQVALHEAGRKGIVDRPEGTSAVISHRFGLAFAWQSETPAKGRKGTFSFK